MDTPPAGPPSGDFWSLIKSVAETGALFTCFSFATGWSYLAAYFNAFGFRPIELDITPATASVFALTLVYRSWAGLLLTATACVAFLLAAPTIRRKIGIPRGAGLLINLSVLLLLFFGAGTFLGRTTAGEDIYADSSRLLSIAFYTDGMPIDGLPTCVTAPTVDCKLLIRAKGNYYFFKPILRGVSGSQKHAPFDLTIYALPESKVRFVQMQRGFE